LDAHCTKLLPKGADILKFAIPPRTPLKAVCVLLNQLVSKNCMKLTDVCVQLQNLFHIPLYKTAYNTGLLRVQAKGTRGGVDAQMNTKQDTLTPDEVTRLFTSLTGGSTAADLCDRAQYAMLNLCPLTPPFWIDVWVTAPTPAGGSTRNTLRKQELTREAIEKSNFEHNFYRDASTSFGWGAVSHNEVISQPWGLASKEDIICYLEVEAVYLGAFQFREQYRELSVLLHTDSMVALTPPICSILEHTPISGNRM